MNKLFNKASLLVTSLALTAPTVLFAADPTSTVPQGIQPIDSSFGDLSLGALLSKIIIWVLGFAAAVAVLFLIIGGLQYVTSAGNKDRVDKAKQTILYAVIGLIVIALSFVIVTFITNNLTTTVTT